MPLDHTLYPLIVERIASTDIPTLLIFRRLSKAWLSKSDAKLFKHVIISRPVSEFKRHKNKSDDEFDIQDYGFELRSTIRPYHRLPCLPFNPWNKKWSKHALNTPLAKASRKRSLQYVSTVDYHGAITSPLQDYFPSVCHVTRHWVRPVPSTKAIACPTVYDSLSFWPGGYRPSQSCGIVIEDYVDDYTLAISYNLARPPQHIFLAAHGRDTTVTIVFDAETPDDNESRKFPYPAFLPGFLASIKHLVASGAHVTFVGVESLNPPGWNDLSSPAAQLVHGLRGLRVKYMKYRDWVDKRELRGRPSLNGFEQEGNDKQWYECRDFNPPGFPQVFRKLPYNEFMLTGAVVDGLVLFGLCPDSEESDYESEYESESSWTSSRARFEMECDDEDFERYVWMRENGYGSESDEEEGSDGYL